MPADPKQTAETSFAVDRNSHTIRFVRIFGAAPSQVFEAWTKPEHVACWWDAAGERLEICEIDLRPGGSFKFVTKGHPDMPFTGVYREIAPPERLSFEALGALGRVVIQASGRGARMIVEIECRSAEQLDQFVRMGVGDGTSRTLDNLVAYSAKRAAAVG
jgi:uncharacterized protein YndB with AHSA1/START domain